MRLHVPATVPSCIESQHHFHSTKRPIAIRCLREDESTEEKCHVR